MHAYLKNRPLGGTCHFGCISKAKLKTQSLVPRWRGAPLGSGICSKCHGRLVREMNDRTTPLITEAGQDPLLKNRLQGPCHFGCTTSAMDNSFKGRMQWHRAPSPCDWPGVDDGATLCNACYVGFRYHAARPNGCLPRDQWTSVRKRALGEAVAPTLARENVGVSGGRTFLQITNGNFTEVNQSSAKKPKSESTSIQDNHGIDLTSHACLDGLHSNVILEGSSSTAESEVTSSLAQGPVAEMEKELALSCGSSNDQYPMGDHCPRTGNVCPRIGNTTGGTVTSENCRKGEAAGVGPLSAPEKVDSNSSSQIQSTLEW